MSSEGSNLIYKQIISNRPSLLRYMPDSLQEAMIAAFSNSYEELYELDSNGELLLEDALEEILGSLQGGHQLLGQLRYVWMALILAVVVEPTVRYYQPDSNFPEKTIGRLTDWLIKTLVEMLNPQKKLYGDPENIEDITLVDFKCLVSAERISSFQVLSEALDVYINAVKTLEPTHSLQALLDILDDCLEGYAIFPGSYGRRELFDWWLLDVVPSCWYLLAPTSAYSLVDSEDAHKASALNRLEEISSLMWTLILTSAQDQNENSEKPLSFYDNTSFNFSDKVKGRIKYSQPTIGGNKRLAGEVLEA